jgi:hypothetical protein
MKTSPCSGRTDWVSVAKENPGSGGGGSTFVPFPGSHNWATFQQAMAEANQLRQSPTFSSYCCRENSVWKNTNTGNYTVVTSKYGNPGMGWQFVKGDMCCDEAAAYAGIPSMCDSGHINANTVLNGTNLTYYGSPTAAKCQADCNNNNRCAGFTWIQAGTYNRSDPAMCYLLSAVTYGNDAAGHYSAMKTGSIPRAPTVNPTPGTGGGGDSYVGIVRALLNRYSRSCRIDRIQNISAAQRNTGWLVTAQIVLSASGTPRNETVSWGFRSGSTQPTPADPLAADISAGCPGDSP